MSRRRNVDSLMWDLNKSFTDFMTDQQDESVTSPMERQFNHKGTVSITVSDLMKKRKAVSGHLQVVYPSQLPNIAQLSSLPWAPRFFVLLNESMYLFSSSEPDEICLDSFELSSSTFVLPKLQRVNAPLAFEVVETCQFSNLENKSWLLRTPNQAAHIMWVTLINKAIEQASIRFSMQPPPPARHGKINSRTEFALQNYFKSMGAAAATESVGGSTNSRFNREGEESSSYLDILQEYDQFLEVVALPQNIRDDSAFGLSSAPVVSNALDYDGPTVYEMGLGGAHGMGKLRSIKSRKSVLSRRNSDTTTNAHLSQEFEDAWRFIAAPVRKSQLMFGIDENKAPTARDEEDLLELVGRGGKVDNGVGVAWLGRSQSEKTPVSNIQNTPPQKVLGFSARAKKWFGF